jgi:hypothetical protein
MTCGRKLNPAMHPVKQLGPQILFQKVPNSLADGCLSQRRLQFREQQPVKLPSSAASTNVSR